MLKKDINFTHKGGTEVVKLIVSPTLLPLRYELNDKIEWINIDIQYNSITVKVLPTFDFNNRECELKILNNNNQEVILNIKQEGFKEIEIHCDNSLVLHHSYFSKHKKYGFYVSVYGGKNQNLICNELQDKIVKVWDNSDMYNDFIIRVSKELSGKFTLYHSEYDEYKKYCQENSIYFDESKVKKEIEIMQISEEDTIGEMIIKYGKKKYKTKDNIIINIKHGEEIELKIVDMFYKRQLSLKKYEVITNKDVDLTLTPDWLNAKIEGEIIKISTTGVNKFSNRSCSFRINNKNNQHQYITVNILQESGN